VELIGHRGNDSRNEGRWQMTKTNDQWQMTNDQWQSVGVGDKKAACLRTD
jgi:hypothetical protein